MIRSAGNCLCAIRDGEGYNRIEFGVQQLAVENSRRELLNSIGETMLKIEIVYCAV